MLKSTKPIDGANAILVLIVFRAKGVFASLNMVQG